MKLFAIAIAGAALLAAPVVLTTPVLAQSATITTGPGGGSLTVREGDRREVREGERRGWREGRNWRRHRAECRVIIERHRRGDGMMVVRRVRTCD